jgi:hypothetical protein
VVTGVYRDFFAATAASAGALTGLLFVAMSVAPREVLSYGPPVIRRIRAAAALLGFSNALAVSLYGLVPTTKVGYPAVVLGVIGITFTAAAIRSIVASAVPPRVRRRQAGLIVILLLIFGAQSIAAVVALVSPANGEAVQIIGYALVTSLILGIGRAWEFIGERDTGLLASLGVLAGRRPEPDDPAGSPPTAAQDDHASRDDEPA